MGVDVSHVRGLRNARRSGLLLVGLGVTVVFTYLAVRDAHLSAVWDALVESDKAWLVPSFAALALAVWLRAVRWWLLFTPATRPRLRAVAHAMMIGYFFNNVLPLRAGEAARVISLHRRANVSRAESAATVVVERGYDVLALLLLLFVILPWLPAVSWVKGAVVLLIVVVAGLVVGAVLLARFGMRPFLLLLKPLTWTGLFSTARIEFGARNLAVGMAGLRRPRVAVEAGLATVVSWVVVALSCWFLMLGFDFDLSPLAGLLVVIAINLALILPSSPAAIGVFEAATVIALGAYDVSGSEALSYGLLLHALNFLPFVAAGLLLLRTEARARG